MYWSSPLPFYHSANQKRDNAGRRISSYYWLHLCTAYTMCGFVMSDPELRGKILLNVMKNIFVPFCILLC
jgi:hypothetical protein